jgi:hypothetical protein
MHALWVWWLEGDPQVGEQVLVGVVGVVDMMGSPAVAAGERTRDIDPGYGHEHGPGRNLPGHGR